MTPAERAAGDPGAHNRGVADYLRARSRWFQRGGEDQESARRLALNDGGSWRAGLRPSNSDTGVRS